ncbi:MAG: hypothetical protein WBA57_05400 [Elainellaceae cyanobacterium]
MQNHQASIKQTSIHQTSTNSHSLITNAQDANFTTLRQIQLEWFWQSKGGNLNVFQQLLPLFDVVEQSADGVIAQESFEARLEELKLVGIAKHLAPCH